jgi:CAAX prenyl protease-like protein
LFAGAAFARIAPFAAFIALLACQPLLAQVLDPRWASLLRGIAAAAVLLAMRDRYTELRDPAPASPGQWAVAVVTGFVVFAAWITFDSDPFAFASGAGFVPLQADGRLDPVLVAVKLFSLVLVVPVMEELFWRSFLMRWIDRRAFLLADPRRASWTAFLLSSALFATEHSQWFAGLLAGAAYAWIYRRSGNLRLSIVSHATTNGTLGLWILATGSWRFW